MMSCASKDFLIYKKVFVCMLASQVSLQRLELKITSHVSHTQPQYLFKRFRFPRSPNLHNADASITRMNTCVNVKALSLCE